MFETSNTANGSIKEILIAFVKLILDDELRSLVDKSFQRTTPVGPPQKWLRHFTMNYD